MLPERVNPELKKKIAPTIQAAYGISKLVKKTNLEYSSMHACSVAQSCPTLCNSMDCNLPDSSVRGIFQARLLE